jgi:acyl-CoA synthetase (AMP-forming)/AMP-acid ligase II
VVDDVTFATFAEVLGSNARNHPDDEAIIDGPRRLTFRDVEAEVTAAARALLAKGIRRGDLIAIWAPNSAEWIVTTLATICCGAAIVPISTRLRGAEASWIIRRSGAKLLFTVQEFLGVDYPAQLIGVDPGLSEFPTVMLPVGRGAESAEFDAFIASGEAVPEFEVYERMRSVTGEDMSNVLFTSGTTGLPKGVVHTNQTNLVAFETYARRLDVRSGDRLMLVLPLALNFGLCMFLMHFMRAGACVLEATFDPQLVRQRVQDERVTTLPGPPTLLGDTMDAPNRSQFDLSSLRTAITGATTISPAFIKRLRDEKMFEVVYVAYGLTEVAGVISVSLASDDEKRVAEYCGTVVDGVEVRLVGSHDEDVPFGEPGEILVRANTIMKGYVNDPEATAKTFLSDWLRTGDIGVMDEAGYLKITDRKKEVYIVGGMNVYPAEVERLMADHPAIAAVAVVGVPDDRLDEVGYAFVVLRPQTELTAEELIGWARGAMANFKVPRYAEFVRDLPVNASMKVLKDDLRQIAAAHRAAKSADSDLSQASS